MRVEHLEPRASTPATRATPELQAKWFIDHALAVKRQRIAAGDASFGKDPSKWGEWIADVERPGGAVPRPLPAPARRGAPAARLTAEAAGLSPRRRRSRSGRRRRLRRWASCVRRGRRVGVAVGCVVGVGGVGSCVGGRRAASTARRRGAVVEGLRLLLLRHLQRRAARRAGRRRGDGRAADLDHLGRAWARRRRPGLAAATAARRSANAAAKATITATPRRWRSGEAAWLLPPSRARGALSTGLQQGSAGPGA